MKVRIPNESRQFSFEVGMNFDPISMRFRRVQTSCGRISQKTDELLRQAAKFGRTSSVFGKEVRSNVETEGWAGWVNVATSRGELASFRRPAIRRVAAQGFRKGSARVETGTCTALGSQSEYGPE